MGEGKCEITASSAVILRVDFSPSHLVLVPGGRRSLNSPLPFSSSVAADDSDPGITAFILTALSVLLIIVTMPFSLCLCIKVRNGDRG